VDTQITLVMPPDVSVSLVLESIFILLTLRKEFCNHANPLQVLPIGCYANIN
jgi:hypothetical protein